MTREELLKIAKPILFNTEMVQAILEGRKSVTRRVTKNIDLFVANKMVSVYQVNKDKEIGDDIIFYGPFDINTKKWLVNDYAPYRVGDILYVRETFQKLDSSLAADLSLGEYVYVYKASENGKNWEENMENWKWKPSIHMPKKAARIFLEVTDVRVEKLQDITKDYSNFNKEGIKEEHGFRSEMHREFIDLWDSTIKKQDLNRYGWDANPWVWVIEFERVEEDLKW